MLPCLMFMPPSMLYQRDRYDLYAFMRHVCHPSSRPQQLAVCIPEIQKLLEPLSSLWDMCSEFTHHLPDWMDGPIIAINAEQVATDCDKWYALHLTSSIAISHHSYISLWLLLLTSLSSSSLLLQPHPIAAMCGLPPLRHKLC